MTPRQPARRAFEDARYRDAHRAAAIPNRHVAVGRLHLHAIGDHLGAPLHLEPFSAKPLPLQLHCLALEVERSIRCRQPPKAKSAAPANAAAARVPTASTQSAALASTSRPTRGVGLEEPTRCCRPSPATNTRRRQVKWHVTALGDTVGKRLVDPLVQGSSPRGHPSSQLRGQSHVLSSDGRADALYPAADRRPGVYGLVVTATPASLGRARPLYRAD